MDALLIIFIIVFLATVLSPIIGTEDRPGFRRPDQKPRRVVGPPW